MRHQVGSVLLPRVLLGIVLVFLFAPPALAEPRFTALYGQDCTLCHVNPTGGGLRTLYASQYLVPEELAGAVDRDQGLGALNPELTPGLVVGADLRTLLYQREGGDGSTFSMQGDLYVHAQPIKEVGIYVEQGQSRSGEIFGTLHVLPADGWIKAGRFIPDHGWRFADHQMATRRYLYDTQGTDDPGVHYASGFEAGIRPGILTLSGSVQEVARGQPDPRIGDNYAYRGLLQKTVGDLRLGAGGSVVRRQTADGHVRAAGGFWYVGVGPVTWLGEVDETKQEGRLGLLTAHEVAWRFARGWELVGSYGFQDPDRSVKDGSRQRAGGGVQVMPAPYFAGTLMVHRWWTDEGPAVPDQEATEIQLVAHFLF